MSGYTLNPDAVPLIMDWLTPGPGDETAALKHQARLLIEDQAREIEALRAWKEFMLAAEATWDIQAVGEAIGVAWGDKIRPAILPAISRLARANRRLAAACEKIRMLADEALDATKEFAE